MLIIGLTGSICSGKTTVARFFRRRVVKVINADQLAHQLMSPGGPCFQKIIRAFGKDILVCGRISRKKLGSCVFQNSFKLKKLNAIVHPEVRKAINKQIAHYTKERQIKAMVLDIPLLIESKMHTMCDIVIVVRSHLKTQIERLKKRGLSLGEARKRIRAQMPIEQKLRYADYIITNTGSLIKTKKQVENIWKELQ
jgi:dephospho-CoA kinase